MAYSGMSREDMLKGLSQHLPTVVDTLTPDGRLPTDEEAARLLGRARLTGKMPRTGSDDFTCSDEWKKTVRQQAPW
jgi:hypothetical protein